MNRRSLTVTELLVACFVVSLLLCVMTSLVPNVTPDRTEAYLKKCHSNMGLIGAGMLLYANDHQYFPHMQDHQKENSDRDVARVYRTLYFLKLLKSNEALVCPGSSDYAIDLHDSKAHPWKMPGVFSFSDTAEDNISGQAPILHMLESDLAPRSNDFLSYTYRRSVLSQAQTRASSVIVADEKTEQPFKDDVEGPEGNHYDGFNVLFGDNSVRFVSVDEKGLIEVLNKRLHLGKPAVIKPKNPK